MKFSGFRTAAISAAALALAAGLAAPSVAAATHPKP
jgi:hypothetical protein